MFGSFIHCICKTNDSKLLNYFTEGTSEPSLMLNKSTTNVQLKEVKLRYQILLLLAILVIHCLATSHYLIYVGGHTFAATIQKPNIQTPPVPSGCPLLGI